ncbi:hypothetical protein IW137_003591, partial [Coemansia sp. RSA 1287]
TNPKMAVETSQMTRRAMAAMSLWTNEWTAPGVVAVVRVSLRCLLGSPSIYSSSAKHRPRRTSASARARLKN